MVFETAENKEFEDKIISELRKPYDNSQDEIDELRRMIKKYGKRKTVIKIILFRIKNFLKDPGLFD